MKNKIQVLSENLANQIAAGEVVDRPASVVKELIENALDAAATEIEIDVERGGKNLIRITDNGYGMNKDDAFLSLERHATSKVKKAEDLFALNTMGFRGEALPAIASVSRMNLVTRTLDEENGWQIYAEGGVVRQAEAVGSAGGTTVEVRNLFYNTPGRRKFLRKDETEFGHIADVVNRLALSRWDVHFSLRHNNRTVLEAYRHNNLLERAAAVLGRNIIKDLVPAEAHSDTGEVLHALLSTPGVSRSSTSQIYTYVNNRFVRDRIVQHAILESYRSLLEKRRYPIVLLFLHMPLANVDVNVHPTKHEVRFHEQNKVHDFIVSNLRRSLQGHAPFSSTSPTSPSRIHSGAQRISFDTRYPALNEHQKQVESSLMAFNDKVRTMPSVSVGGSLKGEWGGFNERSHQQNESFIDNWRVIGQFLNSYIVCQHDDELVLIDQHAAHERIGFERLLKQYRNNGVESQNLLFPLVIELSHREAAIFSDYLKDFERLGFEIEAFGGKAFSVKSVPSLVADVSVERLVRDLAEEFSEIGKSGKINDEIERVLSVVACHAMIRANHSLSPMEMRQLLCDLLEIDFGICCPHGRPVMYRLAKSEVEKFFHRS
jgi:DNA mismatch repair protein MutL